LRKSIVLVVVVGLMFVIFSLTFAALYLMTQESQVAERKVRHARIFYAAQAGMVDALERLRTGALALPTIGNPTISSLAGLGAGIPGYPVDGSGATIIGFTVDIVVAARGDIVNGCPPASPSAYCVSATTQH